MFLLPSSPPSMYLTIWYRNCTVLYCKTLQQSEKTAEKILKISLLASYNNICTCKATKVADDPSHPSHRQLTLLPCGIRCQNIHATITRLCNSQITQHSATFQCSPGLFKALNQYDSILLYICIYCCIRHFLFETFCSFFLLLRLLLHCSILYSSFLQ